MREFKTADGEIVDLDNSETYCYMSDDISKIQFQIQQEIGFYYCYVNYWHPDWDEKQEARVEELIKKYANGRRDNRNNLPWHRETLFIFQDEIENMC